MEILACWLTNWRFHWEANLLTDWVTELPDWCSHDTIVKSKLRHVHICIQKIKLLASNSVHGANLIKYNIGDWHTINCHFIVVDLCLPRQTGGPHWGRDSFETAYWPSLNPWGSTRLNKDVGLSSCGDSPCIRKHNGLVLNVLDSTWRWRPNFWLWTWSATSLMGKKPKPVQEAKTIQLSYPHHTYFYPVC